MSDIEKKKLNNDDLAQVKSLIQDADEGDFSLDEILAEYGSGRAGSRVAVPVKPSWGEKVVAFPGTADVPAQEPSQQGPKTHMEQPMTDELDLDEAQLEQSDPDEPGADGIIQFPEEESVLSAFIKDVSRKADDYADRMFEEDERIDPEQVRRLEQLIPGTDQEEEQWDDERYVRRAPRPEPPPPDLPAQELAKRYGKGLKGMRLRVLLTAMLAVVSVVQLAVPAAGLAWPEQLSGGALQSAIAVGLLGLGVLLGIDVLLSGLGRAFRGRVGMDTLAALSCIFTLTDGVMLTLSGNEAGRIPYSTVALFGVYFLLHGSYHKRCALRLSCRTAAASSEPYRVTMDEGKWNGRDTYTKWSGTAEGFGSQIQMDDGAQRIYRRFCPLLLLGNVLLALLTTVAAGKNEQIYWALSALFTATAAFGGALAFARPFHKVARRLAQSGAALSGWPGVAGSRKGNRVLITDIDLFPPGYVELNGFKMMGDFSAERVLAYAATLIRDSGSGLTKPFHDQLRAMGGLMRTADRLCCYEGGGLSANIRGDQVLVGSAAFMNLMDIVLPAGLNVKSAVFCAINGQLAGIFALSYALPDTVFPSLEQLLHEKVGLVLATRDFNLIPAMLQQRFKLAADKMDFPPVERRRELSDPEQAHSETLTALLCREGLFPFAEAITAAKRLRWATRLGAILCCVGSTLGLALSAYLVSMSAYGSLSALNLLVFMLTWLAPVWLLSGWVHRF